ncbi:4Fe-4S dicluster domain-containing protein [Ideonella sp. B7]|uniref:(Fe-S)-binding protein n=1 Tax=Ideonella benzenivorans TaxID=2831643 RepID=UPI001CEC126E|nr:4Fe-4S dicluster domain-containing protein [Ideonella benzenivorans]MCA6218663.1 4Fe-4S dicluster domain-containing protein [Ideonella benzenivorans]
MQEPSLQLDWTAYDAYGAGDAYAHLPAHGAGFGKAAAVCIGSRTCQRADAKGVMCPSFRATQDGTHSTQHRAAMLRAALDGELGERPFEDERLREALDLCVACKGCKRECPNGVDMALLRTEALAQRWADRPRPRRERLIAQLPQWLPRLRRWRVLLNPLLALRERWPWLARQVQARLGLAAARSLPRPAAQAFLDQAPRGPVGPGPREVVLLVDTFHNQLDPSTAQAALEVLQAIGCRVHVLHAPAGEAPLCCGRSALAVGDVATARAAATRLQRALAPYVERGLPIIGLEPSCLLTLRDEHLALGLGEAATRTAQQAWLLEEYLAREFKPGELPFQALPEPSPPVLVHGHCHQKAFGAMKALRKVLGGVPGLQVQFIDSSCCGMAGAFGYEAEHHAISMTMAEAELLPAVRAASADTWLLANGTSCRHQIHDGAQRQARHLAHLLRAALPATPPDPAAPAP